MKARNNFLILVATVVLILFSSGTNGQILNRSPYTGFNNNLRQLFINLNPPATSDKLYDMTVHLADESFYSGWNNAPNDLDNWLVMYEELYYADYTPTNYDSLMDVMDNLELISNQKVPVMAMDFNYHRFIDSTVFDDTTYFYFDTLNNTLYDNPNRKKSPYKELNVFSGMTYRRAVRYTNVQFKIDPQFLFYDAYNAIDFSVYQFQIDFGDGAGFQTINTASPNTVTVNYPTSGDYTIKYRIYDAEYNTVINQSTSKLSIEKSYPSTVVEPDSTFQVGGLNIGVYEPCEDIPLHRRKAFIVLTGFDPLNETTCESWYDDFIRDKKLENLIGYGHQIYIVTYDNSTKDIRDNAEDVVDLINILKCDVFQEGAEQFTMLGYSMGGLIGRYALLDMENNPQPPTACNPQRTHNCKLFISMDAPQQGANIPMSVQRLWHDVNAVIDLLPPLPTLRYKLLGIKNAILNQPAAKQMLSRHAATGVLTFGYYTAHPMRISLMNEMASWGDYPTGCKNIAISNGALNGDVQKSNLTGLSLPTQYHFLDASVFIDIKVLWWKVRIIEGFCELNSNPNGSGTLFTAGLDMFGFSIIAKLFGLDISIGLTNVISLTYNGSNLEPNCSHSGSYYSTGITIEPEDHHNWWNFGINNSNNGKLGLGSTGGWQYTSDATMFCFIPTQSALDYGGGTGSSYPLTHDITMDVDPATNSPFDVIVGCHPAHWWYNDNMSHAVSFRNDTWPGMDNGFLVREAGDDILWVDNYDVEWNVELSAQQEIKAGVQVNPHYHYASGMMPINWIEGSYSENAPMNIIPFQGATFVTDLGGVFTDVGIVGSYIYAPEPLSICVDLIKSFQIEDPDQTNIGSVSVYPNPGNDKTTIDLQGFEGEENVLLEIFDFSGRQVLSKTIRFDLSHLETIDMTDEESGIYLIKVITSEGPQTFSWVKQ